MEGSIITTQQKIQTTHKQLIAAQANAQALNSQNTTTEETIKPVIVSQLTPNTLSLTLATITPPRPTVAEKIEITDLKIIIREVETENSHLEK